MDDLTANVMIIIVILICGPILGFIVGWICRGDSEYFKKIEKEVKRGRKI